MSQGQRRDPRHQDRRLRRRRPVIGALFGALSCAALTAVGASASSGGFSSEPGRSPEPASEVRFGTRLLRVGMEGPDVKVLKGIIRSKPYVRRITGDDHFDGPTERGVRAFQERRELARTGVVDRATARELTLSMRRAGATWYGPGLYGNGTACGRVLRPGTVGLAHRMLPCGTKVTVAYHGRYLVTRVIDRGPYRKGYDWDLTSAAAERLGFEVSDEIRYAVAR
jgi:hypothetical protein